MSPERICALFYSVHRRDNLNLEDCLVKSCVYFSSIVKHVPMCDQTPHLKISWVFSFSFFLFLIELLNVSFLCDCSG